MRFLFVIIGLYASSAFSLGKIELESSIGFGNSNSAMVERATGNQVNLTLMSLNLDEYKFSPLLAVAEQQLTYYDSKNGSSMMMRLEQFGAGVGVRASRTVEKMTVSLDALMLKSQGSLHVNRSFENGTQIASIGSVPTSGYSLSFRGERQISSSLNLFVGLKLQSLESSIPSFNYQETNAVETGLTLSQGLNGRQALNLPKNIETKTQSIVLGLNFSI